MQNFLDGDTIYSFINDLCASMSNIQFQLTEYMSSFGEYRQIPENELPEFCFWGRSNVGKSSLINFLCQRKELARTSSVPGKTQTFNLYGQTGKFHFMDLPGYGFAKVARSVKDDWQENLSLYLHERQSLKGVVVGPCAQVSCGSL